MVWNAAEDKEFLEKFEKSIDEAQETERKLWKNRQEAVTAFGTFFNRPEVVPHEDFTHALAILDVCSRYDRKLLYLFDRNYAEVIERLSRLLNQHKEDTKPAKAVQAAIDFAILFENHTSYTKQRLLLEQNLVDCAKHFLHSPSLQAKQELELQFGAYLIALDEEKEELAFFLAGTDQTNRLAWWRSDLEDIVIQQRQISDVSGHAFTIGIVGLMTHSSTLILATTAALVIRILSKTWKLQQQRRELDIHLESGILEPIRKRYLLHQQSTKFLSG